MDVKQVLHGFLESYSGNLHWFPGSVLYLTLHGSHAYGTADENSDIDVSGFCVPPREYFTGFLYRFEQAEFREKGKPEGAVYNVSKFIKLAGDCNPNVIELLWTYEYHHVIFSESAKLLLENRSAFLSQRARYSFSGYAMAQLKRIKTHRRWLLSPPKKEPVRMDYGLPERTLIPADQRGAANRVIEDAKRDGESSVSLDVSPNFLEILQKENAYAQARREWEQYQHWKKTRNPARAELEAKFGFDCKHAMHLVRLCRMAKEILVSGQVFVRRPDAEELIAIRRGAWGFDDVLAFAAGVDEELDRLCEQTTLPVKPDVRYLDGLCREIVEREAFGLKRK